MAGTKTQGCKLFYSADDTTYVEVVGVTNISVPEDSTSKIDVTTLSSTAMEYLAGLSDFGSASYSLVFDPTDTSQKALIVLSNSKANTYFKVELIENGAATVTTVKYLGYIDKFSISGDTNSKQDATLVIQPVAAVATAHAATAEA